MDDRLLSTGEVCAVAGIGPNLLDDWCCKGTVVPVLGGSRQGNHRRFTLQQAVGVLLALRLRRVEGVSLRLVRAVVSTFEGMSPEDIEAAIAAGRTHIAHVTPWEAILGPGQWPYMDHRSVEAAYDRVRAAVSGRHPVGAASR